MYRITLKKSLDMGNWITKNVIQKICHLIKKHSLLLFFFRAVSIFETLFLFYYLKNQF